MSSEKVKFPLLRLLAITAAAVGLHGYHAGVEDCETYIPSVKQLLNPKLYPYAPEFFAQHERLSIFGNVVAGVARITHLPADWAVLLCFIACLFAMIAAVWLIASECFTSTRARWSATLVVAAVLPMPAANTALLLMDPYLTARSFSTPLTLLALAALLNRRYVLAAVATICTGLFHPQMAAYLMFLAVLMYAMQHMQTKKKQPAPLMASFAGALPTGFTLQPATGAYREALYTRDYFFLYNWEWYHWLGMLAPLAILAWFWRGKLRGTTQAFALLSFVMIPFGLIAIAAAAVVSSSPIFDNFVRLQPLRTFHLITIVFMLLLAGVFGEYVGRKRPWAIAALAVPLAAGMFFVGRTTYPHSPQIEVPTATSSNPWVGTLLWIRHNTPENAVFAVDSHYLHDDIADAHGFKAVAERSMLADYYKDSGAASLFPSIADEWKQMSDATTGLNHFNAQDFQRLKRQFAAVDWTVIHGPAPSGLACPYQQQGFAVCRIP